MFFFKGGPNSRVRHVGDLGNIVASSRGIAQFLFTDKLISLIGSGSVLGRGIVVHEDADDLGLGGDEGSITTGNAGSRLACCIIAVVKS